jgi:AcrR family transcriptional regulator
LTKTTTTGDGKSEPAKARLLDAATQLFGNKGYGSVSVREICTAAGTSNNMVHHYFGSKDGLLQEIISSFDDGVFATPTALLKKPARSKDELIARLELLFDAALEAYANHRDRLLVALREQRALPAALTFMDRFSDFLADAQEQGFVREELDPRLVSGAMLDRILNQVQFAPWIKARTGRDITSDAEYREQWCKANIDLFLHGIVA